MSRAYLGDLPKQDPVFHYLRHEIFPQLTDPIAHPHFRVFRLHSANNSVCLYEEKTTGIRVVGKFFSGFTDQVKAALRVQQEFEHLQLLRRFGFDHYPHHVVRPLGINLEINNLLVVEFCQGEPLSTVLHHSIQHKDSGLLYKKLTALAAFFAALHNRTTQEGKVDFAQDCTYFHHLLHQLKRRHAIAEGEAVIFNALCERWKAQPKMWTDCPVIVHGDATPSNFLLGDGENVSAIDLERMKYADRVFDIGRIVGELQHHFMQETGNKYAAEPFIGHFLWEYAGHFPDRKSAFEAITARLPFHIGMTLMRIARNNWITRDYGYKLLRAAKETLESSL